MKKKWTQQQEQMFQALTKEREEALAEMEAPLKDLAERLSQISQDNLAYYLKSRADEIRDALEPFDSGVRYTAEGGGV